MFIILAGFHALDAANAVCNGMVRGMGSQKVGMALNVVSYGIGLPLGWVLAFHGGLEERGLWLGPTAGFVVGVSGFTVFFLRLDWDAAAAEAAGRIRAGHAVVEAAEGEKTPVLVVVPPPPLVDTLLLVNGER